MGAKRARHVRGQVRRIASAAPEHRGLLWSSSLRFSRPCPLSHHFRGSRFPPSPSWPLFPPSLREATPGREAGLGATAQPRGSRGAAAESNREGRGSEGKAQGSQWGEGAGPARLHEALHVRLRRGGAGRGGAGPCLAWPGLACSVLSLSGLCSGSGDWDVGTRPALLPRAPGVAEGSRLPGSAAPAGVKLPTDLGIGSWRGSGINTSVGSAFRRPVPGLGSRRTSVLLAAHL